MRRIELTLTPSESKRLIAKGVSRLEVVQRALKNGRIVIAQGTTNAFVAEEILVEIGFSREEASEKVDRKRFAAGICTDRTCIVPKSERRREIIIKNGELEDKSLEEVLEELSDRDVFIKSANALDPYGIAGILIAHPRGGTIGSVVGTVMARGVNFIIPVGLEKSVIYSVVEASRRVGGFMRIDRSFGLPVGIMPIHGKIITEIDALKIFGADDAFQIASGGINGGEGSVVLCVEFKEDEKVEEKMDHIMKIIGEVKGEKKVETLREDCSRCNRDGCIYVGTRSSREG